MKMGNKGSILVGADIVSNNKADNNIGLSTHYEVECYDADGKLKWSEDFHNNITTAGLNSVLDVFFKGTSPATDFYIGLIDGSTPSVADADTMASHAGWTENQNYLDTNNADSDVTRPVWTGGTVAAGSVDNASSKGIFAIDTDTQTIGGCFLTDTSTKGGATGLLYGGGSFSSDKSVNNGDTLNVTVTLTATG